MFEWCNVVISHFILIHFFFFDLEVTSKAEKSIHWSGGGFYQQRDKLESMLTRKLSPRLGLALSKIKIDGSTLSQNPQHIMGAFQEYYQKLYSVD